MSDQKQPPLTSLTKENFWNDLMKKYPGEVQQFCDWIDKYKERVGWNYLFNSDYIRESFALSSGTSGSHPGMHPKYHDLPIAMQIGIFLQYVSESQARYGMELDISDVDDFNRIPLAIREFFAWEHQNAYDDKMAGKYMDSDG